MIGSTPHLFYDKGEVLKLGIIMKKIISLLICFLFLITLGSCTVSDTKEIIFLSDYIHCDIIESGGKFGFNLIYLYRGGRPDVEFVSFDNECANALFEELIDDTIESISGKKFEGYYAVILGFCFDISSLQSGEQLQINEIILSVNGNEQKVDVAGKVVVNKIDSDDDEYYCNSVYSTNVPVVLFSQGKDIESAMFNYHTEDAITIEKFEFSNFLDIQDAFIYVDEQKIGAINEVLPIDIGADKTIRIEITANFGKYNSFSDFYLNSLLYYKSEMDGSSILKDYFAIQAVGNEKDMSNFVKQIIQK